MVRKAGSMYEFFLPVHNLNTSENFATIQAAIYDPNTEENATAPVKAGIYLSSDAAYCNISNNIVSKNYYGIYLNNSSYNTVTSNTMP
jgi:parallel beta-helix repeat protein